MNEKILTTKKIPIIWMFAGQGAQYFQMGRTLYQHNYTFRFWMDNLDKIAINYAGQSIVSLLYNNKYKKNSTFEQTLYTHPALFMIQFAMAKTLLAEGFELPDILFGMSLGTFVAAALAEVIEPEILLFDIISQARLFDIYCAGGGMLLIIDACKQFYCNPIYTGTCELAGINFNNCFIISSKYMNILKIANTLKEQYVTHQVLPVSIAFHSSYIDILEEKFKKIFDNRIYSEAKIPIISCTISNLINLKFAKNTDNSQYKQFSADYWWQIIRQPMYFKEIIKKIACYYPKALYIDVGPAGNMATFTKYNLPISKHSQIMSIMSPFGEEINNINLTRQKINIQQSKID